MIAWQLFIDEPGKRYDANALYLNVLRNVLIRLVQADWCMPGGPTGFSTRCSAISQGCLQNAVFDPI